MPPKTDLPFFSNAAELIRSYAAKLPDTPGVYRMIGDKEEVLYVGKAKSLKKRVLSYTALDRLPVRTSRMVALTRTMEFVHTHTEAEALLLESNLIKKHKPYFNVLLRDDKSFPYILLTEDHDFPTVLKHRGARAKKGEYFGPFASAGDVNRTITTLQRAFMLRNCTDSYFAQRTRPCLQYHIKRCTAPCVGLVTKEQYEEQIGEAGDFLRGKSRAVQDRMIKIMEQASAVMDYETAASYRDRIQALTYIQGTQDINMPHVKDADIFALARSAGKSCVQVFFFRGGQNYGNRPYFPRHDPEETDATILSAFLAQFYENKPLPKEIIVSNDIEDKKLLEEAFSTRTDHKVKIITPQRGKRNRLLEFSRKNATAALERYMAENADTRAVLERVAKLLNLESIPDRIEVYDNSHISGTNMVGAMIVAGPEGFNKNAYRKFNIKQAGASDDYAMMREVLARRFKRDIKENPEMDGEGWPDIVIIDGGAGQLSSAREVLEEFGILHTMKLMAMSKGPDRNAGREKFHTFEKETGEKEFELLPKDPALHYFQRLRDEAHRFAISAHRARRTKEITRSPLDEIPGVGARRKKALLHHFGSGQAVAAAGVEDLQKVPGISRSAAQKIYDHFH
jgi:excinuclease ABC subunit C